VFWLLLVPQFAFHMKSVIEGALSIVALPVCWYVAYLHLQGRDSLFLVSRAIAFMGLFYLPFASIPFLRQFLVEAVSAQTNALIQAIGYAPTFTAAEETGFMSGFVFTNSTGRRFYTYLVLACTGIGSMSIFAGLISSVTTPLRRKLRVFGLVIVIIWMLNLLRNAFIAIAFGRQWFQQDVLVNIVTTYVGYQDPGLTSFFVADRIISQSFSIVALIGITWFVVREIPELLTAVEDVLFVLSGNEYDLQTSIVTGTSEAD
jgi:archaeosortase A (PGF-CTERM-specific)